MKQIKIFIELTRLNKPIGFMLLFWPCAWGLALAYYFNPETVLYFRYLILFFLGSVLMRSAGCIFNDIVDKDFDKKVKRTKKRPIASDLTIFGPRAPTSRTPTTSVVICAARPTHAYGPTTSGVPGHIGK